MVSLRDKSCKEILELMEEIMEEMNTRKIDIAYTPQSKACTAMECFILGEQEWGRCVMCGGEFSTATSFSRKHCPDCWTEIHED